MVKRYSSHALLAKGEIVRRGTFLGPRPLPSQCPAAVRSGRLLYSGQVPGPRIGPNQRRTTPGAVMTGSSR